jgi:hypothetical protein
MSSDPAGGDDLTPIFILGAGHSGTTILFRMVAMHPDVTWFSQLSQRNGTIPGRVPIPWAHPLERGLRRLFPLSWEKTQGRVRELLIPLPTEARHIMRYLVEDDAIPPEEAVRRLRRVFAAECRRWGRRFIVVKSQRLNNRLTVLRQAFARPRFVHLIRDGRAEALSRRGKMVRGGRPAEESLEAAAHYWCDILEGISRHADAPLLELRYEDLCADVPGRLRQVFAFAGLDAGRFPFARVPAQLRSTNAAWLAQAAAEEMRRLENVQGEWLRRYGYGGTR